MPQFALLRIGHIEVPVHQLVEEILGQALVNRRIPGTAGENGVRMGAGDHLKGRYRLQEKRFQMIARKDDQRVGLGFVEVFPELAHCRDPGIQLRRIFLRRPREQLRRVHGGHGSYDLTHAREIATHVPTSVQEDS